MSLKKKLREDLIASLKEKDALKVSVLKMAISSINNEEIKLKKKEKGLSDEEVMKVLMSEAKKRNDSIEAYTEANRPELVKAEEDELLIIKNYLPEEMSDEEIEKIVKEAIENSGATSIQDFGKIMKEAIPKIQGGANGSKVSKIVKKLLG
ncbi:GatB/YqeY domain-containing protein [Patescibacteria group bacterium]